MRELSGYITSTIVIILFMEARRFWVILHLWYPVLLAVVAEVSTLHLWVLGEIAVGISAEVCRSTCMIRRIRIIRGILHHLPLESLRRAGTAAATATETVEIVIWVARCAGITSGALPVHPWSGCRVIGPVPCAFVGALLLGSGVVLVLIVVERSCCILVHALRGVPLLFQLHHALLELVIRVLAKWLVDVLLGFSLVLDVLDGRFIGLGLVPVGRGDCILGLLLSDAADSTHARLEANIIHFIYGLVGPLHDTEVPILVHCRDLALESVHEVRSHSGLLGLSASSCFGSLVVQSILIDRHP